MDDDRENCPSATTIATHRTTRRLNQILRPLNHLAENHLLLNAPATCTSTPSKNISLHRPRYHLSSHFLDQHHDDLQHCLESSLSLLQSFHGHRSSWPPLFLTFLLEDPAGMRFDFRLCHDCSTDTTTATTQHHCIAEEELHQLQMIIRKRKRLALNSLLIDHLRELILIKSLDENQNESLAEELRRVKQTLSDQYPTWPPSRICSLRSKLLLFLSSLYAMKMETMRTFVVQPAGSSSSSYSLL